MEIKKNKLRNIAVIGNIKMIMNKKIEEELEKQFPKGDKARGRALVLHSIAQIEFNELQETYNIAMKEINRLRGLLGFDSDNYTNGN